MTPALRHWWQALSQRERRLVTLLAVLGLPILVWLTVLRPLAEARVAADNRLAAAQRGLLGIQAAAPALRAAEARANGTGIGALDRVRQAVAQAGLTADALEQDSNGLVTLRIAAARGPVLLRLVAGLEADGLLVQSLSVSRNEDSSVTASLRLSETAR